MRVLLDTHALVWWFQDRGLLSSLTEKLLEDPQNVVLVSAASAWELASKAKTGKFRSRQLLSGFSSHVQRESFMEIAISVQHALRAGGLDVSHRDPFDRMLAAQAEIEGAAIVSRDEVFDRFPVRRIW